MPTPFAGELRDDLCYVIALGPGYGETVLVRVPPNEWVIVDALRNRASGPAEVAPLSVLEARGAESACLVLTHPHDDHADGFAEVVEEHQLGPVGCGLMFVEPPERWMYSQDADRVLRRGAAEHAVAAIQDGWARQPESRWELVSGSHRDIGEARLWALYPTTEAQTRWAARTSLDFNELSTPLLLEWRNARIVLGADLPARPWREIDPGSRVNEHDALKVPHHGSRTALPDALGEGPVTRTWFLTPWKIGTSLPVFADGEGVQEMLCCVDALCMTALPVAVPRPDSWPRIRRRHIEESRRRSRFGSLTLDYTAPTGHFREAWVLIGVGSDGAVLQLELGDDSALVIE
jgi:beta-lactamase superfamily II metal-dependent hydrolase